MQSQAKPNLHNARTRMGAARMPGEPQRSGPVWHGRPQPPKVGPCRPANDLADKNDLHPDDIKSITVRLRGKLVLSREPFGPEASAKLAAFVADGARKTLITVHLHDGGMVRYRGNGRIKAARGPKA